MAARIKPNLRSFYDDERGMMVEMQVWEVSPPQDIEGTNVLRDCVYIEAVKYEEGVCTLDWCQRVPDLMAVANNRRRLEHHEKHTPNMPKPRLLPESALFTITREWCGGDYDLDEPGGNLRASMQPDKGIFKQDDWHGRVPWVLV